jgi:hypothetical protein
LIPLICGRTKENARIMMAGMRNKPFEPVDISWLAFFRILFGGVMVVEVCRYFVHGWVNAYSLREFHFGYYGFEWLKPWPGEGMRIHFAVLGLCAACIAMGLCYRVAAVLFFLGFTYVFLLDETRYLNHFYLISLTSFLMIFMPAHHAWSADSWRCQAIRSDLTPAWTLWLMRAQVGIPYFFGGIAKLNSDWLHGEPMRMWLAHREHLPVIGPHVHEEWMVYFFAYGGLLLDLFIVPCLLWRRTRVPAFLAAATFHLMNSVLFRIGIFPWLMLGATFIFFPPDLPRRVLQHFKIVPCKMTSTEIPRACLDPRRRAVVLALVGTYLLAQVLIPFRHLLYPGNVHWTEEGHRFSWHMKLRSKDGDAIFYLTSLASRQQWKVDPIKLLLPSAYEEMVTHPDMILQYSHYLAEQKRREGIADIEVRVRAAVSLNGRPAQLMIDPTVDLAKEKRDLRHARWILPLHEPLHVGQEDVQDENIRRK